MKITRFLTKRKGRPGTVGLTVEGIRPSPEIAHHIAVAFDPHARHIAAAARGKIALDDGGRIETYQADAAGSVDQVACGNATAAAILRRILAGAPASGTVEVNLPSGTIDAHYRATHDGGTVDIAQAWRIPSVEFVAPDPSVRLVRTDAFNDYWIVAATELGRADSANSGSRTRRVAVIDLGRRPPFVVVETCGGTHGGLPLTGLVVLTFAAATIDWLAPLGGGFDSPGGHHQLLAVEDDLVDLPCVEVHFLRRMT